MNCWYFLLGQRPAFALSLVAAVCLLLQSPAVAAGANLYSTGFEPAEGFDINLPLADQAGWIGVGTDSHLEYRGNGIVTNFIEGNGQHAYIGYSPLTGTNDTLNIWRPLNYDPIAAGTRVVRFSVSMAIFDSTNRVYDCFRWSVYNNAGGGQRLFSIDFDNSTLEINYLLDSGDFVPTGFTFTPGGEYDLEVTMNFADNRWSAMLNGVLFVSAKPITTIAAALTLGDIDAVWVYGPYANAPGNDFMVFDNYRVTAEAAAPLPFQLEGFGRDANGDFSLRLTGEPGRQYAIDVTIDFADWSALQTNSVGANGTFDFVDTTAVKYSRSFYRARLVP